MKEVNTNLESVVLTKDQEKSLELFCEWLKAPYSFKPFVMKGFAGSGKTYLSVKLLKKVDELGLCWTVVAPTHKACLLYTSPSPRDLSTSRMPSSA